MLIANIPFFVLKRKKNMVRLLVNETNGFCLKKQLNRFILLNFA